MTAPAEVPALVSSAEALAAEFPAWEVTITPNGMWSAYWESEDRRHRRFIIAPAAKTLLQQLRRAADADQTASDGHQV
jgi:hypothetical protein